MERNAGNGLRRKRRCLAGCDAATGVVNSQNSVWVAAAREDRRADDFPSERAVGARAHERRTVQFLTIDGRRWRRSDPTIPESLRQQLVNELMSARRAVAAAGNARDREAGATPRSQRETRHSANAGVPGGSSRAAAARNLRIDAAILALLHSRSKGASICPSEAARIVGGKSWRASDGRRRGPEPRCCLRNVWIRIR